MLTDTRPDFDQQLLGVADLIATRSTCSRLHVGAVLARDTRVISSGYNGAPAGQPHCEHVDDTPCRTAVHAEANAIQFARARGVSTVGTTLYVTHAPCLDCALWVVQAGVGRVVYADTYRSTSGLNLLAARRIPITRLTRQEQP